MIGWKKIPLGDAITLQRGYDLPSQLRRHGVVPVISSAGTSDWHDKAMVTPPGVVTGRYGTIGKLFFIQEPFWPLNTTLYVKNFHGNEPRYIYYLLQLFDFNIFSGKSGVPGVNRNDIHAELVCIPNSIEEQQAIVGVLSDADALIDALEQCIAKKRHIKQGAMQELLTGKRRLPGFKGEWKTSPLEAICSMRSGISITEDDISYNFIYPCFGGNGMRGYASTFTHDGEYVLIGRQGALCGNIVKVKGKFFASEHALVVTANPDVCSSYLAYIFIKRNLNQYAESSAQPGLSAQKLLQLQFVIPPTLNEQAAIAAVLTAMDDEIVALEAKLSKAKQIKAGMMQELLTGRTRLV